MGKMTGLEPVDEIPSKVLQLYRAVEQLIGEGVEVNEIRVASVTERAGIGKGTAYDYFDSKEEIIACAFLFYLCRVAEKSGGRLLGMSDLRTQLEYIFDEMDKDSEKQYCFVRFVHGATDNSKFSQLVRAKLMSSTMGRDFPEYLFGPLIRQARERGEIGSDIPTNYLIYTVFCKLLTYMMGIGLGKSFPVDIRELRTMIIDGIIRDAKG